MTTAHRSPRYGRLLSDFEKGATYEHPWDVTIDGGTIALFQASFLDATPTYASREFAKALSFRDRPIHPFLLLNLGLSFSVHDVSEQAIAHLAYIDVRFPNPCYANDTVRASSTVLDSKPSSAGDKGVVHVRTVLENSEGTPVCTFERKALVRAGKLDTRPEAPWLGQERKIGTPHHLPENLRDRIVLPQRRGGFAGFYEDFEVGDVIATEVGKTIGESEHMQLTALMRNSHPLHFDEVYCKENSFAKTRVVYGGLVLTWVATLASRDTTGNVLWDIGLDQGAHPNGVVAGDTLYATSKVLEKKDNDDHTGLVTFRLVGTKNVPGAKLLSSGVDLFAPELDKKDAATKVKEKCVEITRTVLMRKRPGRMSIG
ncbi:MAG: MaoC family dehydratase [Polyangiales bacterium]